MAARKTKDEANHRALDELQAAVDQTMEPGDAASQRANLRRAAQRERETRPDAPRKRRPGPG